jgi:hypothetical protein
MKKLFAFLTVFAVLGAVFAGVDVIHNGRQNTICQNSEKRYWQTSSTGVIHNSSCRLYKRSKGKMVDSSAVGRNCKICGGNNK